MSEQDLLNCGGNCDACGSDDCEHATVTLTLDDGSTLECAILTVYSVGEQQYIALLPMGETEEGEEGEVYLYRFREENGSPALENIEDDDEYEAAADAFDELLDEQEFEEMEDEE